MALRIALVTPFAWSQPHDVNEHVAGIATELRKLGHSVTVLAPSTRARDLAAGRRALFDGLDADVVALGPAVPISRCGTRRPCRSRRSSRRSDLRIRRAAHNVIACSRGWTRSWRRAQRRPRP